jgi:hypothetical protein
MWVASPLQAEAPRLRRPRDAGFDAAERDGGFDLGDAGDLGQAAGEEFLELLEADGGDAEQGFAVAATGKSFLQKIAENRSRILRKGRP